MKNNKFKLIAFLLALICVATISYGCGKSDSNTEITDSNPITTITASAVENPDFNFKSIISDTTYRSHVLVETTTDTLWVFIGASGVYEQIFDPETGLPLTYTIWLEKYANR